MIPEGAVEAAARAAFNSAWRGCAWDGQDGTTEETRERFRRDARAALEAATPAIYASAYARAFEDAAALIEPFSGIGLANGATRGEVARWLRDRAAEIGKHE